MIDGNFRAFDPCFDELAELSGEEEVGDGDIMEESESSDGEIEEVDGASSSGVDQRLKGNFIYLFCFHRGRGWHLINLPPPVFRKITTLL